MEDEKVGLVMYALLLFAIAVTFIVMLPYFIYHKLRYGCWWDESDCEGPCDEDWDEEEV